MFQQNPIVATIHRGDLGSARVRWWAFTHLHPFARCARPSLHSTQSPPNPITMWML